jgi:hypothetical protein
MESMCLKGDMRACKDGLDYSFKNHNFKKAAYYGQISCNEHFADGCFDLAIANCSLNKKKDAAEAMDKYFIYGKDKRSEKVYKHIQKDRDLKCIKDDQLYIKHMDEYKAHLTSIRK